MGTWFKVKKDFDNVDRLYVLEIAVEGDTVYKVGKSSGHSSKARMLQIIGSYFDAYRVTPVIRIVKDKEVSNVFAKEAKCHHLLAEWKYESSKKFSGCQELFKAEIEKVLEVYKSVLESEED